MTTEIVIHYEDRKPAAVTTAIVPQLNIAIHYEDRKPAAVTTAIVPQLNVAQEDPEQAAVELLASNNVQLHADAGKSPTDVYQEKLPGTFCRIQRSFTRTTGREKPAAVTTASCSGTPGIQ